MKNENLLCIRLSNRSVHHDGKTWDHVAIITNVSKYQSRILEIEKWLEDHQSARCGMTLVFPSEQIANWFELRWLD